MPDFVKKVEASAIHERFDLQQEFVEGVNIIHGKNGAGKTTFLHILANILNADYKRFRYLKFKQIEVELGSGTKVLLSRQLSDKEETIEVFIGNNSVYAFRVIPRERELSRISQQTLFDVADETSSDVGALSPLLPAAYFPAFRTMIEAWASANDERDVVKRRPESAERAKATKLARDLFGQFIPQVNYPSPLEIEQILSGEIQRAVFTVAQIDERLLSQAFLEIFAALSTDMGAIKDPPEQILEQIKSLNESLEESSLESGMSATAPSVYTELRNLVSSFRIQADSERTATRILDVYRNSLSKRAKVQKSSFELINRYLDSVNEFLEEKKIEKRFRRTDRYRNSLVGIKFVDGGFSPGLKTLSSGERQIITLIYAATHMNEQKVVLIDEPEISLHVDWQRMLIQKMSDQLGGRQIIACTHSPVIAANYEDRMMELGFTRTTQSNGEIQDDRTGLAEE